MSLKALKTMCREEVEKELTTLWGATVPPKHTSVMLKSLLQDHRAADTSTVTRTKSKLPTLKKDLLAMATKKGVALSGNETNAVLQRKIQEKLTEEEGDDPKSTEISFGKHKGKSYDEVYRTDKNYCEWVVTTVIQSAKTVHPDLIRLAQWIDTKDVGTMDRAKVSVQVKERKSKKVETHYIGETPEEMQTKITSQELKMKAMQEQIIALQQASSTASDSLMMGRKRQTGAKASPTEEEFEVIEQLQSMSPRSRGQVEEILARRCERCGCWP